MRVGIDGYNLAIPRGTGVATYARTLSHCLHALGHRVDVLYGMPIAAGTTPAMRTVAFLDMLQNERHGKAPKYPSVAWARLMMQAYRGAAPVEIPVAGAVPGGEISQQLPAFDRVLNVTSLFQTANRYFRNFGRFMQVRMANPPAIMHWTYPVPVTLQGARNIYTIHDLVPLRLPYTTLDNKPVHMQLLTECLRVGDHICTVSDTSRADILQFFSASFAGAGHQHLPGHPAAPHAARRGRDASPGAWRLRPGARPLLPVLRLHRAEEEHRSPAGGLSLDQSGPAAGLDRRAGVEGGAGALAIAAPAAGRPPGQADRLCHAAHAGRAYPFGEGGRVPLAL